MAKQKRKLEDEIKDENLEDSENIELVKKRKQTNLEDETVTDSFSQNPDFNVPEEAEVGIVEKVVVTNFMCHKKLEVSLGPNVNFIIGRNGSGKSAILTGLIVGLGGKATTTSRGNSLKGFIKEGCHACHVIITLRNRGTDAYQFEQYGKSIIVERRLTVDGGGGYKLKSFDNRVISTRRDDLIQILDHFNIQIDNPVSILNQDTSRSFLNTSNEKDKYMFFLKATQLEQMSNDYQEIFQEKEVIKETLSKKRKAIPDQLAEVKELEEKYNDIQELKGMKGKVQGMKKELAWAMVAVKKEAVINAEADVSHYKEKLPNIEQKIAACCEKEKEAQILSDKKGEEQKCFIEEVTVLDNEKTELHSSYRKKKNAMKIAQDSCKKLEREINSIEKDKKCLITEINDIKDRLQRDLESDRQFRGQQLEIKDKELSTCQAQLATSSHHCNQLDMAVKRNEERKYNLQKEIQDAQRILQNKQSRLKVLQDSKNDKLSSFGLYTANVLKAIDTAHRQKKFHRKPLGPLGSLIKLKDPKWALAVEQCIKGLMSAYACYDNHDMLLLKDIFKHYCKGQSPLIIVSKFADHLFDTTQNTPGGPDPTVLAVLDIENHVVANSLIDQCNIESVLMIEDPKRAQHIIWKEERSWKAFSIEGHEIIGGRSSKYYPCRTTEVKHLQADVAANIRQIEGELQLAQNELIAVQQQQHSLNAEIRKDKDELGHTRKKCMREQDLINKITMEIQEIKNFEEEKLPDVAALETEVEECDEKLVLLHENLNELQLTAQEKLEGVQEHSIVVKECQERCQVAIEKLEQLNNDKNALDHALRKVKGHRAFYHEKMEELLNAIKTVSEKHEASVREYEKIRSQALQYSEEVETKRTVKSLESEIINAEKRIEREEQSRENPDDIIRKYEHALQKYQENKQKIEKSIKFRKMIDRAIRRRASRFESFQKFLTQRARHHFQMLLSQRGYTGKMKIDHEEETLQIQVNVENASGASTKDSKSLSGGERSFSTICFIMALWEAMEAPFRCLDEFDVFMDMLNRRISMNMLLKIAKEQQQRQFILLTPQDMSNVSSSNRVRIFKLKDPERGQQTIPFQPS